MRHEFRCKRQNDPADPSVPLAWVFKRRDRIVGRTPPQEYGEYRELVVGPETWFVHCSFAGAITLLLDALGDENVNVAEGEESSIRVSKNLVGSWIGHGGQVAGFLKCMLGIPYLHVVGVADWQRR